MNRRDLLASLPPAIGLSAGCNFFPPEPERDLWSVSVESVEAAQIELDIQVERRRATTTRPPVLEITYRNPTDQDQQLRVGNCPARSTNEDYFRNLILWPASRGDEFHPDPISEDCWKPDPDTYSQPCEAVDVSRSFAPGESWSIRVEVWLAEELDCRPAGTFQFEVWARGDEDAPVGTFELRTRPIT